MSDTHSFASLYQCIPTWRAEDEALWRLAREYHERTEAFDETHPDRTAQCRHARAVHAELCARTGMWPRDLTRAMQADAERFETDWHNGVRHFVPPVTRLLYPLVAREPRENGTPPAQHPLYDPNQPIPHPPLRRSAIRTPLVRIRGVLGDSRRV